MNPILSYVLKTAIYLGGFYCIYFIFLSRDTNYRRNRIFIILTMALSLLMPYVRIIINNESQVFYFGKTLSEIFVTSDGSRLAADAGAGSGVNVILILFRIYIAGIIVFTIKLFSDIIYLITLILRSKEKKDRLVRFKGINTVGFSALGYIFINQSVSGDEADDIIKHEMNHLRYYHFYDILLLELIKILQWFNPVVYLLNRSLRAIHEYQADQGYLRSGMSVTNYQSLLLNHVFRTKIFLASNSFSNPTLIKKRMVMMTKKRSGKIADLKILFALPVVAFILVVFSCSGDNNLKDEIPAEKAVLQTPPPPPPPPKIIGEDTIYTVVEEMPAFPGGDKALIDFIYSNVKYPDYAKENKIQGKVIVSFCVTDKGTVDYVQLLQGIDSSLDDEALRVVGMLPAWKPGKMKGRDVNVWYSLPISFALQ
jgi:TonB family protein